MERPADRLKASRIAAGYPSARQAAIHLGIPEGTYFGHENDNRSFGVDEARFYAARFGVEPEYLLFGSKRGSRTAQETAKPAVQVPLFVTTDTSELMLLASGCYPTSQTALSFDPALLPPGQLYVLKIADAAMARQGHPSFEPGMLVIMTVDANPKNYVSGDIANVVLKGHEESVFRQVVKRRQGAEWRIVLCAFNRDPAYGDIEFDETLGDVFVGKLARAFYFAREPTKNQP